MILVSRLLGQPGLSVATDQLALAIIVTSLIEAITAGKGKHTARILSTSPLVYVGRISYGIYLYHMFAPNFLNALKAPEFLRHGPLGFLVMMLTTLFVASASWFAIERPINSFKHCFPYLRTPPVL
jgi:peptidoglycan/LPS O-acetylase OafA/YrhL